MATKEVEYTERHGGDLVAEVLKAHKVPFIFCLAGGHISPFLVASKREGIRIIDVRHEVNAVFAADANAQMAQSPLGRGALQDIDQMAVLRPIVKYCEACSSVRDIVPTLREAFRQARSGVPGPVFVELPLDVLYPMMEMLPQLGAAERLRTRDVTAGGPRAADAGRVILPKEAASLLRAAKRPVILVGSQGYDMVHMYLRATILGPDAVAELRRALEGAGMPCFLGGMARGLLGRNNPIHIRQNRGGALRRCDLVVMLGAVADFRLQYGSALPKGRPIITVNRSKEDLTNRA
eukprot:gene25346-41473_t